MLFRSRRNWEDSDDLAMLFEGTYNTKFYRMVRDLLHDEVRMRQHDDRRWMNLTHEEASHRTSDPVKLAS